MKQFEIDRETYDDLLDLCKSNGVPTGAIHKKLWNGEVIEVEDRYADRVEKLIHKAGKRKALLEGREADKEPRLKPRGED